MHSRLNILLLCILAGAASASAQDVENALNQFKGKVLVLRHPSQGQSQQYDSDGRVLNGAAEGPWTVYGGILIDSMTLQPDQLRIEGERILFLFSKQQQQFTLLELKTLKHRGNPPIPPSVHLAINLAKALDSAEQARTLMKSVFVMNTSDLLDSLPEFWRGCLRDRLAYDPTAPVEAEFSWQARAAQGHKPEQVAGSVAADHADDDNIQTTFHVGPGVNPPAARFTPPPEYSQIAQYVRLQGTVVVSGVVAKDGTIHRIRLVRPLGLGLDEAAEAMVRTWRFSPATHNGQPVAVEMNLESDFRLD